MDEELAEQVRAAATRPEVSAAVHDLYERLRIQVELRKPICALSGKCCRFEEYGHRLYVTTMELAAFVRQLKDIPEKTDQSTLVPISPENQPVGCPFQMGKMCGVHAIRPFGCRIFYCDPTATDWQREQYELFHRELKQMHVSMGVHYFYVEWRRALGFLGLQGKLNLSSGDGVL